jgi:hypothetical protein
VFTVRAVVNVALVTAEAVVAVAAFPVQLPELPEQSPVTLPVNAPAKPVAVTTPVLGLYVKLPSVSAPCVPVAPSTNIILQAKSSLSLSVQVNPVATAAVPVQEPDEPEQSPVTFPVRGPENPVAVKIAVEELKESPALVFGPKSPVAAVAKSGKQEVSVASLATVIAVGVAVETVDQESTPDPFVVKTWLASPSEVGSVKV